MSEPVTAAEQGLASCHLCCKLVPATRHHCPRCGSAVHLRKPDSLQRTLALALAATVLYFPANIYPIMYTDSLGTTEVSTIIGGVLLLIELGSIPVAAVIFVFSVIVPTAKLMILFYLSWTVKHHSPLQPRQRALTYRIIEFIGKWSMIDVFVVAILAALVHLTGLLVIRPGIAAISFAAVVIITILAAECFDSRLIWDNMDEDKRGNGTG